MHTYKCFEIEIFFIACIFSVDFFNLPVALSYPHFLYAAEHYLHGVVGLTPDVERHNPVIDLEPVRLCVVSLPFIFMPLKKKAMR